jgi:hypothetical protein
LSLAHTVMFDKTDTLTVGGARLVPIEAPTRWLATSPLINPAPPSVAPVSMVPRSLFRCTEPDPTQRECREGLLCCLPEPIGS